MRIAANIHRLDPGGGLVNVYLLDDGGQVTIIDAGAPRYFGALPAELAAMGRSLEDVRSVVLTHAHTDHIGFAERIRRERGVPIRVHEADAALARGEVKSTGQQAGPISIGPILTFTLWGLRNGMLRIPPIRRSSRTGTGPRSTCPGRRA